MSKPRRVPASLVLALTSILASACSGPGREPEPGAAGSPDAGSASDVDAGSTAPLHVLFVGNSLTSVNDLPNVLSRIAATAGQPPTIETEQIIAGGATLWQHLHGGVAAARIAQGGLTHVVLQGQSSEPLDRSDFASVAVQLGEMAEQAGAIPVYFDTWAPNMAQNTLSSPLYGAFYIGRSMAQDYFTQRYAEAAAHFPDGVVACAGEAFRIAFEYTPGIPVQQSDGVHPTLAGTYLAAATFYVALTGHAVPDRSEVPAGLDANDAATLRSIALTSGGRCTTVRAKAFVVIAPCQGSACARYDIARFDSANPGPMTLLLVNIGGTAADLSDRLEGSSFRWAEGSAFPGLLTAFEYRSQSYPPCTHRLEPQPGGPGLSSPTSACAVSVRYQPGPSAAGALRLDLTHDYRSDTIQVLSGTP